TVFSVVSSIGIVQYAKRAMPFRYFSSLLRVALAYVVLFQLAQQSIAQLVPIPAFGVNLARGFRISLYAGPELANDIYAMTLDPYGNVLVTSQGYIKRLQDTDGDGRADSATL